MAITDVQIRQKTCPDGKKQVKLYDGDGLYIQINASGSKLWRLKYKLAGKEKLLALGRYPDVSLKAVRRMAKLHNADVLRGVDPSLIRKRDVTQCHVSLSR